MEYRKVTAQIDDDESDITEAVRWVIKGYKHTPLAFVTMTSKLRTETNINNRVEYILQGGGDGRLSPNQVGAYTVPCAYVTDRKGSEGMTENAIAFVKHMTKVSGDGEAYGRNRSEREDDEATLIAHLLTITE
jgi:hypothetical protein